MTTATAGSDRRYIAVGLIVLIVLAAAISLAAYFVHSLLTDVPADPRWPLVAAGFLLLLAVSLLPVSGWKQLVLVGIVVAGAFSLPADISDDVSYGLTAFCALVCSGFLARLFVRAATMRSAHVPVDDDEDDWSAPTEDSADVRRIVGLCGYAKAGKDTAAKGLLWEGDWTHASFAKKIKDLTLAINPLVSVHRGMPGYDDFNILDAPVLYVRLAEYVEKVGLEVAKDNPEVRELLQRAGTDGGRNVLGDDVWVDAAMADLPAGDVVFTDVRFPNEATAIQDAGGYVIRVHRPGYLPVNPHASETALDDYPVDFTVINDSTRALAGRRLRDALDLLDQRRAADDF